MTRERLLRRLLGGLVVTKGRLLRRLLGWAEDGLVVTRGRLPGWVGSDKRKITRVGW